MESESDLPDEQRIDQVVDELKNYRINVAGSQETKWFGAKGYRVGDSIVLTSGREVPSLGRSRRRGEGIALVLRGPAIIAWRNGGSQWKAWGSRIISATLACDCMFFLVMLLFLLLVGMRRMSSLILFRMHFVMLYWEISMLMLVPELSGGMRVVLSAMAS